MGSLNRDYNVGNSCLSESEPSDKTTMKNVNDLSTSQILSWSDEKDSKKYDTKGRMRAGELMNIQEEQEYTTNEAADVLMESSWQCDTDEDVSQSRKDFIQNYWRGKTNQMQNCDSDHIDSEVLLSSPKSTHEEEPTKSNTYIG